MSARAKAAIERARAAAAYLDSIGQPFHANNVRTICRANQSYATTLAQLHKDNMELREQLQRLAVEPGSRSLSPGSTENVHGW